MLAGALLCATGAPASADTALGASATYFIIDLGGDEFGAFGARGELARKLGPFELLATTTLGYGVMSDSSGGFVHGSVATRYAVGSEKDWRDSLTGFIELGLGVHRIPGATPRPDASFGAVFEIRIADTSVVTGLHFLIAERPRHPDDLVAAAGMASADIPVDVGVASTFGVRWW